MAWMGGALGVVVIGTSSKLTPIVYGGDLPVPREVMLRRQAVDIVHCEIIESRMALGTAEPQDIALRTGLVANIRRGYDSLGWDRIPRLVDGLQTLSDIARHLEAAE